MQLLSLVEKERCASDLMYTVLMHPDQVIGGAAGGGEQTVVHRLVTAGFEIITKKYAPDLQQSRMIREARNFVTNAQLADTYIQRFVFLFMLHREVELQELISQAYVEGKHLWGSNEEARAHFQRFLSHLNSMVQQTLDFPCSELNMVDVVHNMVNAVTKCYLIKF